MTKEDIKLKQAEHWSFTNRYITVYVDKEKGIQRNVTVKRLDEVRLGKTTECWYIDGFKDKFKTVDAMLEKYNSLTQKSNQ